MIGVLGDRHVRQQARPGESALDRPARRGRLHDCVAARARQLRPDVADHFELRRHNLENLGDILAQRTQRAAALGTSGVLGGMRLRLAGQLYGSGRRAGFLAATPWG